MPPRKSNVSVISNGPEEQAEPSSAKTPKDKDGLSVDDLSLPKSMVARLAKGVLPANTQIQKDALLALHKSATVFVSYIASNANENAQNAGKKTIMPLDVIAALKDAEFENFVPRLEAELKKYNATQCDKRNTYRRKIKDEKAAAAARDGEGVTESSEIVPDNSAAQSFNISNGHKSITAEDRERPFKKFKADDGGAVNHPDAADDEEDEDAKEEGESEEEDDETESDEEEEEGDGEEDEGDEGEEEEEDDDDDQNGVDEEDEDEAEDTFHDSLEGRPGHSHDEAMDEDDSE